MFRRLLFDGREIERLWNKKYKNVFFKSNRKIIFQFKFGAAMSLTICLRLPHFWRMNRVICHTIFIIVIFFLFKYCIKWTRICYLNQPGMALTPFPSSVGWDNIGTHDLLIENLVCYPLDQAFAQNCNILSIIFFYDLDHCLNCKLLNQAGSSQVFAPVRARMVLSYKNYKNKFFTNFLTGFIINDTIIFS